MDRKKMRRYRLSKAKYLSALQCHKRLWLEIHQPELIPEPSPGQQRIFDQGTDVGLLATEQFPGGKLIEADYLHISDAVKQTEIAIKENVPVLFEACFIHENVLVRPDVLKLNSDGSWDIVEVKSTTSVKEGNIHDVSIQVWVMEGVGSKIKNKYLMHINNECTYPDLSDIFLKEDITDQVDSVLPFIPERLAKIKTMLAGELPKIQIGQHCSDPYECPFIGECWQHVPDYSVFTIPRLRWSVKERLVEEDCLRLEDIPPGFSLIDSQLKYLNSYKSQQTLIDKDEIKYELEQLKFPLYFLDFETDGFAVPKFDGTHPYEQIPFQYSCHILKEDGTLMHKKYLHLENTDPRFELASALTKDIETQGTIIAYNAGFERGVISRLASFIPSLEQPLNQINSQLWDLLVIFRNYYMDWRFQGSFSLKSVLPVLVPDMSYADLDISNGGEAQITWEMMLKPTDDDEKEKLRQGLIEYCKQDTMAMVVLYQKLKELTS